MALAIAKQFAVADRGRAKLANHNAARAIGKGYRFAQAHASGRHGRKRGNDGVARARYVKHFTRQGRYVSLTLVVKQCHASFTARQQ